MGRTTAAAGAVTPGRGRVLLRRVESGESYPGGKIIIPETVRDALMAQHAEVVAVGANEECQDNVCQRNHIQLQWIHNGQPASGFLHPVDPRLRPGAWVLVAKRAGVECGDETGKSYLVTADDILAVLQA